MRRTAILACLVSLSLVTACVPAAETPVSPDPGPGSPSGTNPFPRLQDPQPGQPLVVDQYFADPQNKVKVSEVTITGGVDTDEDGRLDYTVMGQVDLGDKGVHDVEIIEASAPAGSGKSNLYRVMDRTDESEFILDLSADRKQAEIRHGEDTFTLAVAGEEQLSISGGAAVSLDTAAQQGLEKLFQGKVSPHAVALLYARLLRSPNGGAQAYRTQVGATPSMLYWGLFERYFYLLLLMLYPGYVPRAL